MLAPLKTERHLLPAGAHDVMAALNALEGDEEETHMGSIRDLPGAEKILGRPFNPGKAKPLPVLKPAELTLLGRVGGVEYYSAKIGRREVELTPTGELLGGPYDALASPGTDVALASESVPDRRVSYGGARLVPVGTFERLRAELGETPVIGTVRIER